MSVKVTALCVLFNSSFFTVVELCTLAQTPFLSGKRVGRAALTGKFRLLQRGVPAAAVNSYCVFDPLENLEWFQWPEQCKMKVSGLH